MHCVFSLAADGPAYMHAYFLTPFLNALYWQVKGANRRLTMGCSTSQLAEYNLLNQPASGVSRLCSVLIRPTGLNVRPDGVNYAANSYGRGPRLNNA